MVTLRQAAQQALEALERADKISGHANNRKAITALHQAIGGEQQAEPVAWECKAGGLKRLTQHQYEAQSDAIKRHYTRIQPAQQPALTAIPSGWKLIPVEPTREMLTTWIKADVVSNRTAPDLYRAMLAAAPEAPAQQPPTEEQIDAAVAPLYRNSQAQRMGRADDIATARAIERAHGIK